MANLKRLVEVSSLLTVLIFFITEVQSQSSEISVKRAKQGLKRKITNQQKDAKSSSLHFLFFIEYSDAKELEDYYLNSLAAGFVRQLSKISSKQYRSSIVGRNGPGGI